MVMKVNCFYRILSFIGISFLMMLHQACFSQNCTTIVGGSHFDPIAGYETNYYNQLQSIEQQGPSGNYLTSPADFPTDATDFDGTKFVAAETSNPSKLRADFLDTTDNMLVVTMQPGTNKQLFSYKVGGLKPGSAYSVSVKIYHLPTYKSACHLTNQYINTGIKIGVPSDANGNGMTQESFGSQAAGWGQMYTYTVTGTLAATENSIDFQIWSGYNVNSCSAIGISDIQVTGCLNPKIKSSQNTEVCTGEETLLTLDREYNATSYLWEKSIDAGLSWTKISTAKSVTNQVTENSMYRATIDGLTTPAIAITTVTCCQNSQGKASSRETIFLDDFGRFTAPHTYTNAFGVTTTRPATDAPYRAPVDYIIPQHQYQPTGGVQDGYYAVSSYMFKNVANWLGAIPEDHAQEQDGGYLVINVAPGFKGLIYDRVINNLCEGKTLYFDAFVGNANTNSPPKLQMNIYDASGTTLLTQSPLTTLTAGTGWIRMQVPTFILTGNTSIRLQIMSSGENWNAGNDLVIDDIRIMACAPPNVDIFSDFPSLTKNTDVCTSPLNLEFSPTSLLTDFYGGSPSYLFQWSKTPTVASSWVTLGAAQTTTKYTITPSFTSGPYAGLTNGNKVYYRVVAATAAILSSTTVFDGTNTCKNFSVSLPIETTVNCPTCTPLATADLPLSISASATALCPGNTAELTTKVHPSKAGAQYDFLWYKGPTTGTSVKSTLNTISATEFSDSYTVSATSPGVYTLMIRDHDYPNSIACQYTASVTITANPLPSYTISGGGSYCSNSSAPTVVVDLLGTKPFTFSWSDGKTITTSAVLSTNQFTITPTSSGIYSITDLSDKNCIATVSPNTVEVAKIQQPDLVWDLATDSIYCAGINNTALTAKIVSPASPGVYSYKWKNVTDNLSLTNTGLSLLKPLGTKTYELTVSDSSAGFVCTQVLGKRTITLHTLPSVTAVSKTIAKGQSVTLQGSGALNYIWDGGIIDNIAFSPLVTNTYTVTGTDANGCVNTGKATVTVKIPATTICQGDSVELKTSLGGIFQGWTPVADIANPLSQTTKAAPKTSTQYVATSMQTIGNIFPEGDFEGTTTASIQPYSQYIGAAGVSVANHYAITINPIKVVGNFGSFTDHTSGSGNMMVINGGPVSTNYVLSRTITVKPNTNYAFSAWVVGISQKPIMRFNINGVMIGTPFTPNKLLGYAWQQFYATWNSGSATTAIISIYDQSTEEAGNDLALDDIEFSEFSSVNLTDTVKIIVNALPTITTTSQTVCAGQSTTLKGTGALIYNWSNGIIDNSSFVPTKTQIYIVTGTDGNDCKNTASAKVTVNSLPTITAQSQTICFGETTNLTGIGATNYVWDGGITDAQLFTPTQTQTYNVTGTDGNGCKNTSFATVTVNPLPTITAQSQTLCFGESTSLIGNGAIKYDWSGGIVDAQLFTPAKTETYNVTGTDGNGCVNTTLATITVNQLPTITAQSKTVCFGESTMLSGNGAQHYDWDGGITNAQVFTPSQTQTYTVTGTDGNTCKNTTSAIVTVNQLPTITAQSKTLCFGQNTMLEGKGANSYVWDGGIFDAQLFTPTKTQTYNVTGTDGNGCKSTSLATVTVHQLPTIIAQSQTICIGQSTKLSANGADSYIWDGGITDNTVFAPLATQTYTVTGIDGNGCQNTATALVTINPLPTPVITSNDVDNTICFGNTLKLDAGLYKKYEWSNLQTSSSIDITHVQSNIKYTVTVTDANDCLNSTSVNVTVNDNPKVDLGSDRSFCADSVLLISASPNMDSYLWSTSETSPSIKATNTQDYSVTVTKNACSGTDVVHITVSSSISVDLGADKELCMGDSIVISPGSGYDSYLWSDGSSKFINTIKNSGIYKVTVTSKLCQATDFISIKVNPLPSPVITSSDADNKICSDEQLVFDAGAYTSYVWQNYATSQTIVAKQSGEYSVSVTDANGCKNSAKTQLTVFALPTITAQSQEICLGESVKLKGNGASIYVWSVGIIDNTSITPATTQTYYVTGTDGNGCKNTTSATVDVHQLPNVMAKSVIICFGQTTKLEGENAKTYLWDGGITNDLVFTPSLTQNYTVTGIDGYGCKNTAMAKVTVHSLPTISAQSVIVCKGTLATLNAIGAILYSWDGGIANNNSFLPASTQSYTVTGVDANTCQNTASATVTVYQLPTITVKSQTVCFGESTKLEAKGAKTYNWDNGIINNQLFTPQLTKLYTVQGIDNNSCENTATATVTVNTLPFVSAQPQTICLGFSTKLNGDGAKTYSWDGGIVDNKIFTPTSTQNFTVTGTDVNGCKNTATATITVNSLPIIQCTALPQKICIGEYSEVNATGANTYVWNKAVGTVQPISTTEYLVTGTDVNGCVSTGNITVTVNQLPTIFAHAVPTIICVGENSVLSVSGADTYVWNTNTTTVSPIQNTMYYVTGTSTQGCVNTDSIGVKVETIPKVTVTGDTMICENSTKINYIITPNDSNDVFTWSVSGKRVNYSNTEGKYKNLNRMIDWIEPGIDTIKVVEDNGTCKGYNRLIVRIAPHAQPDFSWEIPGGLNTVVFNNETEKPTINEGAFSETIAFNYFKWNFGRENDSDIVESNDSYIDNTSFKNRYDYGDFNVRLISNNDYCVDSIVKHIFVDMKAGLFVPNAFVPENKALGISNFKPVGFNLETYKIWIYDTWGNLLWYSDKLLNGSPLEGWDGTVDGDILKTDCYIWKIEASFIDGTSWEGQASSQNDKKKNFGNVLLLR